VDQTVTAERVNLGLTDVDGLALTNPLTGTTVTPDPLYPTGIINSSQGDFKKEIDKRAGQLNIQQTANDPCGQNVMQRMGSDELKATAIDIQTSPTFDEQLDINEGGTGTYLTDPDNPQPAPEPPPDQPDIWIQNVSMLWCGTNSPAPTVGAGPLETPNGPFTVTIVIPDFAAEPTQRPTAIPGTFVFSYSPVADDVPEKGFFESDLVSNFNLSERKKEEFGSLIMRKLMEQIKANVAVAESHALIFKANENTHLGVIIPKSDTISTVTVDPLFTGGLVFSGVIKNRQITVQDAYKNNESFRTKYQEILDS